MTVVDASVAVKWLLPEEGAHAAALLLASGDGLMAPALIRVEVAAAIARKVRLKEIEALDGEAALALWLQSIADGVIMLVPDGVDLQRAWNIATTVNHPLQDCLYLALAERIGASLVTADDKFVAKARGKHVGVRWLGQI